MTCRKLRWIRVFWNWPILMGILFPHFGAPTHPTQPPAAAPFEAIQRAEPATVCHSLFLFTKLQGVVVDGCGWARISAQKTYQELTMLINPQWNVWQRIPFSREVISQSATFQPSKRWYYPKWNILKNWMHRKAVICTHCLKFSQSCQPSNQTSGKKKGGIKNSSLRKPIP